MFNDYTIGTEASYMRDADARERSQSNWDELQDADVEIGWETPFDRATRRAPRQSPIDAPCCCQSDPAAFTAVAHLERDMDTGYLDGTYYRCDSCGTRICEEDYASLCEWTDRKFQLDVMMQANPIPAEFERRRTPRRVA